MELVKRVRNYNYASQQLALFHNVKNFFTSRYSRFSVRRLDFISVEARIGWVKGIIGVKFSVRNQTIASGSVT